MFKNYMNKMVGIEGYNIKHIPVKYQNDFKELRSTLDKGARFKLINRLASLHRACYTDPTRKDEADSVFSYMKYVTKSLG